MEAEYVNKNVVLECGGQELVEGLVTSLLPNEGTLKGSVSDLILMITSDILQSLLVSHQDTTCPEHHLALLNAVATCNHTLLVSLQSATPFIIENTALLLHLLSTHPVSKSIREAALS